MGCRASLLPLAFTSWGLRGFCSLAFQSNSDQMDLNTFQSIAISVISCPFRRGGCRRKFRSQTSDNMDRWKSRGGKSQRGEEKKREDAGARKGRKVAIHSVFLMICGSGGSTSRIAKAAGAEPCGQMRHEKLHAAVARSTFERKKAKNASRLERFWNLRCRKSARHRGAKHMSKPKSMKN